MIRIYDIIVITAALTAMLFSLYLFLQVDKVNGLFMGVWVSVILCFGIYGKLLRIVHFVLYKNLEEKNGEDNG